MVIHTGRHCCLLCKIPSDKLKAPRAVRRKYVILRTLENLTEDHANFLTEGNGDLGKAKEFFNVICPYFFKIPLDQVQNYNHCR